MSKREVIESNSTTGSHVETHKYEYTNTQIHEAIQPDSKKCTDEGLESAREEVGEVTVA